MVPRVLSSLAREDRADLVVPSPSFLVCQVAIITVSSRTTPAHLEALAHPQPDVFLCCRELDPGSDKRRPSSLPPRDAASSSRT